MTPHALSAVLNLRFVTLLAPETLAERQANAAEAVAAAERVNDPLVRFYAYHWRAYACIEAGDILAARSWAEREQDIADRFRQPTTLWLRRADEANLAIIAGELDRRRSARDGRRWRSAGAASPTRWPALRLSRRRSRSSAARWGSWSRCSSRRCATTRACPGSVPRSRWR